LGKAPHLVHGLFYLQHISDRNVLQSIGVLMKNKIYIGNLPCSADRAEILNLFEGAGHVTSANVITNQDTGVSQRFALVTMETDSDADDAIDMFDGVQLDGNAIIVNRELYPAKLSSDE
jgi:cold-inducible RNA-binding protein